MNWLRQNRYGYLWITLAFFVISIIGQWLFGWFAYVNEQTDLKAPIELSDYTFRMLRDTLEIGIGISAIDLAGRGSRGPSLCRLAAVP